MLVSCTRAPGGPAPAPTAPAAPQAPAAAAPTIATLPIDGPPAFVTLARDVVDLAAEVDPSNAAMAGLFDDAVRVPSFSPEHVAALVTRIDRDLTALRALPSRSYPVDVQMDHRWVIANAETLRHALVDERMFEHRPAQWLESLSNVLIAFVSYVPERADLQRRLFARVPGMVAEMRAVAKRVPRRDVETATALVDALAGMAKRSGSAEGAAAAASLASYRAELDAMKPEVDFQVVGAASYAWRYQHALLLASTPDDLLRDAEAELAVVDAELRSIAPTLPPPAAPTPAEIAAARALTRDGMLALYDDVEESLRASTLRGGWITIPAAVGAIHARETPDAMVPLTGDGGSMNPPPTYIASNVGYWNVEHFHGDWTETERLGTVRGAEEFRRNGMGPYAAHEGFPGHHLQLSIARLHKDALRSVLTDGVLVEGWALYAEEALASHGGLGDSVSARASLLRSYRHRIARVIFDSNIERGAWDLQRGADFKSGAAAGQGKIDDDVLRAIQWPTQLVHYFAGKRAIVRLRDEVKQRRGARWDERAFHDALLAEGSIPIALVRAKMLGEPIPE